MFDPASFGNIGAGNIPEEFIEQIQQTNSIDVPSEFQGVYNVRYSRPIFINPTIFRSTTKRTTSRSILYFFIPITVTYKLAFHVNICI